jgi:uncharacterized membrane protein YbhN (UPF0104 family)
MRAAVARLAEIPGARHISFVLKFGVSIGLIVLVFRQIDAKALVECLATQSAIWIAATVLVSLLQIALLTLRWQQILRALGSQSGLGSALAVTFMGCFFGAFLFGPTGSDVARAVLAPTRSLGRRGIVHSVLFERLASVIGLGLAAAPLVALDALPLSYRMPLIAALVIVVVIFVAIIGITQLAHGFLQRDGTLFSALHELELSWRRLIRGWPRFAAAVVIAAAGQLLVAVEAWCLARSQHLGVPFVDFAILMPTVMLLVALPISAGGWGVREGAIVAALALVGVETAPALVLSVELGLIWTLVALPGGVIWLHRWFRTPRPSSPGTRGVA